MLGDFGGWGDGVSGEESASSCYGSFSACLVSLPEVDFDQVRSLLYLGLLLGYGNMRLSAYPLPLHLEYPVFFNMVTKDINGLVYRLTLAGR